MGSRQPAARWCLAVLFLAAAGTTSAVPPGADKGPHGWWSEQDEGWFFYNWTPPPEEPEKADEQPAPPPQAPASPAFALPSLDEPLADPVAAAKAIQAKVEEARARAVLQPTPEHVTAYLQMQQAVTGRAAMFADVGKRAVWTNPEFTPRRPTTPAGISAWSLSYEAARVDALQKLSERYGLFFFFRSDCPFCKEFAPYLKRWTREHDFDVVAVSLDGGALPEFPEPRYLPRVARRLGVTKVPAVYLAEPGARDAQPISFGIISLSELEQRIFKLTQMAPGETVYRVPGQEVSYE